MSDSAPDIRKQVAHQLHTVLCECVSMSETNTHVLSSGRMHEMRGIILCIWLFYSTSQAEVYEFTV